MTETFDRQTLVDLVLAHLDAEPASLQFSPVQTGRHNSSYWVDSNRGRFVLRIAPPDEAGFLFYERRMMRQEPELHALIRARTTIPVAGIVGYNFERNLIDRDYLLMSALPGVPLSEAQGLAGTRAQRGLRQVGEQLQQLHRLTAPECLGREEYGYLGSHRPMKPQPTWPAAFEVMWRKLIDDVVACGSYTAAEARAMLELFDRYREHFERPVLSTLLHMDVWSENILVDSSGNVTGLVDFDRALWGDVEIEYAVLDYCGISEPPFWQGYGRERELSPPALIRRQFYLLYEIQKYMPISVWRRGNPARAARYKEYSLQLAAQLELGRLEIGD